MEFIVRYCQNGGECHIDVDAESMLDAAKKAFVMVPLENFKQLIAINPKEGNEESVRLSSV